MKTCVKCGVEKPIGEFYPMVGMRDGYRNDCKACNRAAKAARYRANPEPTKERTRRWQEANPERYREGQRRVRQSPAGRRRDRAGHLKRKFRCNKLDDFDDDRSRLLAAVDLLDRTPKFEALVQMARAAALAS